MNYKVQSGDTLGGISKKFFGTSKKYKEIAAANSITDYNKISVGQVLVIPQEESKQATETKSQPVSQSSSKSELTEEQLQEIAPNAKSQNIKRYLSPLNTILAEFDISTALRKAHFIAQIAHESGAFRYDTENLNYSAKALRAVFGKYFPNEESAEEYARQPERIANRVYANRMNNGNEASGDGWRYRGRGLIQLTGKENYTKCGSGIGIDLVNSPEELAENPDIAVKASCWYWDSRNLNKYADQDDIKAVTKRINGGYNGLEDRKEYLERAKVVFDAA